MQRAAAAVFSPEGRKQTGEQVAYYMANAALLREGLGAAGFTLLRRRARPLHLDAHARRPVLVGLLRPPAPEAHVVATPGAGFGAAGEGYIRLSAFNSRENVEQAIDAHPTGPSRG